MDTLNFFTENEQFIFMILFIILLAWTTKKADNRENNLIKLLTETTNNYVKISDRIEDIETKLNTKEEKNNDILK